MKYSLRSLMIALLILPPLLALASHFGGKLLSAKKLTQRQSYSLGCMVTSPRIVIQPEDEARLGLNVEEP
jgi:hypothetical protein